ncbi:MAG: glycine--tRNA ligase subunit beta [Firmicutes bacterium]|nr:glycine--tRNA ligase subunit beta [Bacillota bacterium]
MMNKFLLEIGTEEIPSRFIDDSLNQLKNNIKTTLKEERISFEDIKVYATPRRLVAIINEISGFQSDLEELVKGPSKKIGYDEKGNPTKALEGFARGQGVALEDIIIKDFKGEEYIYANKVQKGKKVTEVLQNELPQIIKNINFPKPMKWGGKNLKFARPIRWIISLFNDEIVKFDLEGIIAGNVTRGHRFLGSSNIKIANVDEYFEKLRENYVIVDQNERMEIIKSGCEKLAKEKGGNLLQDKGLLKELTYIVEYPTPLIGNINHKFLDLPKEVITTPMKEHQRYYPVVDDKDRLLPYFIAVRNGNKEYLDTVAKGNEKVIEARLEDAKFFFEEDTKYNLEDYVNNLKNVVFQEKLGTIYDKTIRIKELTTHLSEILQLGDETESNIQRAAYLSKADLVTNMVNEFSELQGIMGREYAKISGENEIVSLAIYEHYLPRFSEDDYPTTTAGAVISIADKLDTICGCFAIGIQPTGSQDPYGLRRQALGIINIILDKNINISIDELIDNSLSIYKSNIDFNIDKVKEEIIKFFKARMKNMFINNGIRYDVVDAIINVNNNITDLQTRAIELNKWIKKDELEEVLTAFNRVVKLANKANETKIDKDLLKEEEEKKLYQVFSDVKETILSYIKEREYDKALDGLLNLKDPIDDFFDNVMVMVDDEDLKNNRLALIKTIANTMNKICDLSKIKNK